MRRIEKPWGYELWWAVTERYVGKLIHVNAGESLSLQYHRVKHESMYVLSGSVSMEINGERRMMQSGDTIEIPPMTQHRVTAIAAVDLMEVSTPELDDVVRLEDRYGRVGNAD